MSDPLELIERYFENSLSDKELEQFQRRLKEEPEFAQAFQLEQDLMEGIEMLGNQDLREDLNEIYQEEIEGTEQSSEAAKTSTKKGISEAKVRSISRRWWLGVVAASVAVLVLANYFGTDKVLTPAALYAEYNKPEFNYTVKSGGNDELIAATEELLQAGDYPRALLLLDSLITKNPEDGQYLLDKGIALVAVGRYEEGIAMFNSLKENKPLFKNDALWYEALAYLKQGEIEACLSILTIISKDSANAQELYDKLQIYRK